jgi:putative ABC transport system permease protein
VLGLASGELAMVGFGLHTLSSVQVVPLALGAVAVVVLAVASAILSARAASKVRPAAGLAGE